MQERKITMKKEMTEQQLKQNNGGIFYFNGATSTNKYPWGINPFTMMPKK